jgi:hypothetical protein
MDREQAALHLRILERLGRRLLRRGGERDGNCAGEQQQQTGSGSHLGPLKEGFTLAYRRGAARRLLPLPGARILGFRCGIVGLPNVGKSTLFNALTETAAAQAANYPFCTIEPNVGRVAVPDPRLQEIARIAKSASVIETSWSSSTLPASCAARRPARGWATSSSAISARWTRSSMCCAASKAAT